MTQLTAHAKTILRAIADGKQIEMSNPNSVWFAVDLAEVAVCIQDYEDELLRIKPETRSINGVEFAAPVENGPLTYQFYTGIEAQRVWSFIEAKDRDTAYRAIVDALEGKSK